MKKFFYYLFYFYFGVIIVFGFGFTVIVLLEGSLTGLALGVVGILIVTFGLAGIRVSRGFFLPISYEEVLGKAKKHLKDPVEIKEFCQESKMTVAEIHDKISRGVIVAYEYRDYLFIENDM